MSHRRHAAIALASLPVSRVIGRHSLLTIHSTLLPESFRGHGDSARQILDLDSATGFSARCLDVLGVLAMCSALLFA